MTNKASQVELLLPPSLKFYDNKAVIVKPSDFLDSVPINESLTKRYDNEENHII